MSVTWKPGRAGGHLTLRTLAEAWRLMAERAKQPPRRYVRYVSSEEYAVHCVVWFLQWGAS